MSAKGFQARKGAQGDVGPSVKRPDTAREPFALNPLGWGGGRRLGASGASSVDPTTAFGAFLPSLARRSQRGPFQYLDRLLV